MNEFQSLMPYDNTEVHKELMYKLGDFLYNLPVSPRKYRDIQVGSQAIKIISIVSKVLDTHGLKVVKSE